MVHGLYMYTMISMATLVLTPPPPPPGSEAVISHPDEMENLEQYRALANYERRDSHQVNLTGGQLVHVIEKHDTGEGGRGGREEGGGGEGGGEGLNQSGTNVYASMCVCVCVCGRRGSVLLSMTSSAALSAVRQ